jgi:hypothetical protein
MPSKLAQRILNNLNGVSNTTNVAFKMPSPEQIQMIVDLINQLVTMLKGCKKTPEQTVAVAKAPTSTDTRQLKVAVRKQLGFFRNLTQGSKVREAVLKSGKEVTLDEVVEVWNG